ncbi:MAG: glycogen debranching enzyme, partial [Treponema sp.]|nr:glycogen debranching enzyme [Treponema sp.]
NGNNNVYCQDNQTSWFDWSLAQKNSELLNFTRAMIRLRKEHPTFSRKDFFGESEEEKRRGVDIVWYDFDGRMPDWSKLDRFLACVVYGREFDKDFYIAANTDSHDMNLILPTPESGRLWARVVDTSFPAGEEVAESGKEELLQIQNRYVIPANSFVVLMSVPRT